MAKSIDTLEPLASAIGHMTIAYNHCHSLVFLLLQDAIGGDVLKAKSTFFALRNDGAQRDVTAALLGVALYEHPILQYSCAKALKEIGKIAGRRNDFIHAIWHFPDDQDVAKVWLDARPNLVGRDPVQEAWSLSRDLTVMSVKLRGLQHQVHRVLFPPPPLGLLAEPPLPQAEQTASLGLTPTTDEPEALSPQRPTSEK